MCRDVRAERRLLTDTAFARTPRSASAVTMALRGVPALLRAHKPQYPTMATNRAEIAQLATVATHFAPVTLHGHKIMQHNDMLFSPRNSLTSARVLAPVTQPTAPVQTMFRHRAPAVPASSR